jgi:hypothetical protein
MLFRYLFDKTSMRATGKEITYKHERSEIEFIIKLVSVLIQNTFSSSPQISIDW